MQEADFFCKLNIKSNIAEKILKKVEESKITEWSLILEQTLYKLSVEDFLPDIDIYNAIHDLGSLDRLSVYKFEPNINYRWHTDKIRHSAINMVIDGFDSFCAFGTPNVNSMFTDVYKLEHKPDTYYVINVKKHHTVFNFHKKRYLLSIGIPDMSYDSVLSYFFEKKLIDTR